MVIILSYLNQIKVNINDIKHRRWKQDNHPNSSFIYQ